MIIRPRRLRRNSLTRDLVADTRLSANMFILPVFVTPGKGIKNEIKSMPGVFHFSPDELVKQVEQWLTIGISRYILFGTGESKNETGSTSCQHDTVVAEAITLLRKHFGNDIFLATDICLCAYTTHGHCGILHEGTVKNDETLDLLAKMALTHAQAGADMVAPSDMMDGRVGAIRELLDQNSLIDTSIMAYSVKYASNYYGPFRDAADSSPQSGDRKSYQMDFRRKDEGLTEAWMDINEGADIVMVKPALAYLDIISKVKSNVEVPVACYNVSGEYSMVKLAVKNGLAKERELVMENMYAFARSGADIIISYHVPDILGEKWL